MSASKVPYDANEFTGKRILVTGGTRGIGEAIVNRLVRGGGTVLATARTIPMDGKPEQFIQADVSTRAGADHVIKTTFDRLGGLDILIKSVGGSSAPGVSLHAGFIDSALIPFLYFQIMTPLRRLPRRFHLQLLQIAFAPAVIAAGTQDFLKKPDPWFATVEAKTIAANILSYQSDYGGWPKNMDLTA